MEKLPQKSSELPLRYFLKQFCLLDTKLIINIIYLFTAIGLLPGGSGYFTCKQNMKLVTNKFKSGGGGYMRSM